MKQLTIKAQAPFDFAATARFLRFTEREAVDTFRDGCYRRALHINEDLRLLSVQSCDTHSPPPPILPQQQQQQQHPTLAVTLASAGDMTFPVREQLTAVVQRIFSTDHNLNGFRQQVAADPLMSNLEQAHRGLHIPRWPTLFEALVISILSQQISTTVAMTFKRRLVERFGEQLVANGIPFFAFPQAQVMARAAVDELRLLGLSGAKALSIIEVARACADDDGGGGRLNPDELACEDNESVITRLSRLRGVGRWTAEWSMILYFGRTNVFPAGDLALRNAVIKYYNKGAAWSERDIRSFAESQWGRWASYAAVYLIAGMRSGIIAFQRARTKASTTVARAEASN